MFDYNPRVVVYPLFIFYPTNAVVLRRMRTSA